MNKHIFKYKEQYRFKLKLALYCSLFLIVFFIFFQPFGVNNYQYELAISWPWILEMCSFGIPVFMGIVIGQFIIHPMFIQFQSLPEKILPYLLEFIIVGSLSFLHYNLLGNFHDFRIKSYLLHLINISAVIILPYVATIYISRFLRLKKKYKRSAKVSLASTELQNLHIFDSNYKNDTIALQPGQILFINSQDNYACIHYIEKNELKRHLIRSTLRKIEDAIQSDLLVRCHRSYIVNLSMIESYKKNKSRITIQLKHYNNTIPVSKKNIRKIDQLLETYLAEGIQKVDNP